MSHRQAPARVNAFNNKSTWVVFSARRSFRWLPECSVYTHRAIENPLHVETVAESSRDNPAASLFYPHILDYRAYEAHEIKNLCETPVESVDKPDLWRTVSRSVLLLLENPTGLVSASKKLHPALGPVGATQYGLRNCKSLPPWLVSSLANATSSFRR